jgi:hypothetical protein
MRKILLSSLATASLAWSASVTAADVQVMTQNQYLGGNIAPVIVTAGTPDFNDAVVTALQEVAASRTPERIHALAREILERKPHLVGLQEVWKFECEPFPGVPLPPGYGCDDPSIRNAFNDHLDLTREALGDAYDDVAQVTNLDIEYFIADGTLFHGIPFFINGAPALLRVTDRDVIFARSDVAPSAVPVDFACAPDGMGGTLDSDDGCNYFYVVDLDLIGRIERGYVGVDVTVDGSPYRFVNTHLETRDPPLPAEVQAAQMAELIGQVLPTSPSRHLILVGDFNSDPNEPASTLPTPYMLAAYYGFYDAWALRPGDVAGFTCCQRADLRNLPSLLSQRIDHVFVREMPSRVKDARTLGATANYRLMPHGRGLWPSDHAAVAATLFYR